MSRNDTSTLVHVPSVDGLSDGEDDVVTPTDEIIAEIVSVLKNWYSQRKSSQIHNDGLIKTLDGLLESGNLEFRTLRCIKNLGTEFPQEMRRLERVKLMTYLTNSNVILYLTVGSVVATMANHPHIQTLY